MEIGQILEARIVAEVSKVKGQLEAEVVTFLVFPQSLKSLALGHFI